MENLERRYLTATDLEVRQSTGSTGRQLVGYAVRYGALSDDLGFRERIASGAFSESLRSDPDVRALVDHDSAKIIGRTRSGTLQLIEDERGVRVEIDPPNTQVGRDLVTSVERGDVTGMSFGFRALDDSWERENGESVRTVNRAELFDVSVCAFPAYPDTSIAVRSLDRWKESNVMADKPTETQVVTPPEKEVVTPPEAPEEKTPKPERRSAPVEIATARRNDSSVWRDVETGREIRRLSREDRLADLYREDVPLSLGRAVQAIVRGDWRDAQAEQRFMSSGSGIGGGYMIPSPVAANVLDKMRALLVLNALGAKTVPMTSGTLQLARVTDDATFSAKSEGSAFTASDLTFDALNLVCQTVGAVAVMSRELAADAPNAVEAIETALAQKLARKIDYYGLRGSGSAEPLGLINFDGLNTVNGGSAAWEWDDILDGIEACEIDNHQPTGVVASPANWTVLRKTKTGDGTNSAKNYMKGPDEALALNRKSTSAMPDTDAVVGNFSHFLIGLRAAPEIEVSTVAEDYFTKHMIGIKITARVCFNTEYREAFAKIYDIA